QRASGYHVRMTFVADVVIADPPLMDHVTGVDVGLEYRPITSRFRSSAQGFQFIFKALVVPEIWVPY
ncbi:MAG: hypothetical protein AAGF01_33000, partial [Cyanobacteria bacterium P01_G01_bin.38]